MTPSDSAASGFRLEIGPDEYSARVAALQTVLEREGLDGLCVFGPVRVSYLTGFFYAATERPIALAIPQAGEPGLLIPQLEADHLAQQCPDFKLISTYLEYPGGGSGQHPLTGVLDLLKLMDLTGGRLAVDHDGYENRWGYRGPKLSQLLGRKVAERLDLVDDMRMVKSTAEVALIEEACRWGDHAHRLMHDAIREGSNELLVSHEASLQATREMLTTLGERYVPKSREGMPAQAMFIAGQNTSNPHGLHKQRGVQRGDVLVTGAFAVLGGYESELERTMIVGEPSADFIHFFEAMVAAQDTAFSALRPGRRCCDVEGDVTAFIRNELDMVALTRHHTGHAFGLEGHEHPFLDLDDETVIEPGMIFSLEPGLYIPGLAGFRHSDTVLVTETGCRNLCRYPRDLASLTVTP